MYIKAVLQLLAEGSGDIVQLNRHKSRRNEASGCYVFRESYSYGSNLNT
jgi:hypothetical protein